MFPNPQPNPMFKRPQWQLPPEGRLTNPVGTFLSNPSTAPAGQLGGPQPTNLPQINVANLPQIQLGQQFVPGTPQWFQANAPRNRQVIKDILAPGIELYNEMGQPIDPTQANDVIFNQSAHDIFGNTYRFDRTQNKYVRGETPAFSQKPPSTASANSLVGLDPNKDYSVLTVESVSQLFPGRSFDELKSYMATQGYTFMPTRGSMTSQGTFMLTGEAAKSDQLKSASGAVLGPIDTRGRPEWVDPTTLARGERVQVSSGTTYVGGQEYTNQAGETVSQYAVTVAQNLNKKLEEKGAYKWVSKTVKDENGNWVKVYSKQLRAPYTRRGRNRGGGEEQAPLSRERSLAQRTIDNGNFHQLVTLRVNYG